VRIAGYGERRIKMIVFAFFGGKKPAGDVNIENLLGGLSVRDGKIIERDDVKYVKSVGLDADGKGMGSVLKELQKGNVVILNVQQLLHNKLLLRSVVKELRDNCVKIDGDLARLSEEKIILLPGGMKVTHAESGG
jgi:SepF-like predicted cell division protein (DUF552 family)